MIDNTKILCSFLPKMVKKFFIQIIDLIYILTSDGIIILGHSVYIILWGRDKNTRARTRETRACRHSAHEMALTECVRSISRLYPIKRLRFCTFHFLLVQPRMFRIISAALAVYVVASLFFPILLLQTIFSYCVLVNSLDAMYIRIK